MCTHTENSARPWVSKPSVITASTSTNSIYKGCFKVTNSFTSWPHKGHFDLKWAGLRVKFDYTFTLHLRLYNTTFGLIHRKCLLWDPLPAVNHFSIKSFHLLVCWSVKNHSSSLFCFLSFENWKKTKRSIFTHFKVSIYAILRVF